MELATHDQTSIGNDILRSWLGNRLRSAVVIVATLFCVTYRIEPKDEGGWTAYTPPNNPTELTVEHGVHFSETILVTVCNNGHTTISKP